MGTENCLTAKACGEAGKIRATKPAKGIAENGTEGGVEIHLCNLCEGAWAKSGKTIHRFTGLPRKGRVESYEVPMLAGIRNAYKGKGISQHALAKKSGVDRSYIQAIEYGQYNCNTKAAAKLARALGVEVRELRGL
jgi:DNA-binding XRE family transcriptional regulator